MQSVRMFIVWLFIPCSRRISTDFIIENTVAWNAVVPVPNGNDTFRLNSVEYMPEAACWFRTSPIV